MKLNTGFSLLEATVALGILMICLSYILPTIMPVIQQLHHHRFRTRHLANLQWIATQICEEIQFYGPSTAVESILSISASPIITYQRVGSHLRRHAGGATQTMSTMPITRWSATQTDDLISFKIETTIASVNRTCGPW